MQAYYGKISTILHIPKMCFGRWFTSDELWLIIDMHRFNEEAKIIISRKKYKLSISKWNLYSIKNKSSKHKQKLYLKIKNGCSFILSQIIYKLHKWFRVAQ